MIICNFVIWSIKSNNQLNKQSDKDTASQVSDSAVRIKVYILLVLVWVIKRCDCMLLICNLQHLIHLIQLSPSWMQWLHCFQILSSPRMGSSTLVMYWLGKKHIMLYLSANWNSKSRMVTSKLIQYYNDDLKDMGFEIAFFSTDFDKLSFDACFADHPC